MYRQPLMQHSSHSARFFMLLLIIFASLLFCFLFSFLIAIPFWGKAILDNLDQLNNYEDPTMLGLLKYFQIVSQIGLFIVPALLYSFLVNRNISGYLNMNVKTAIFSLIIGIVIMLSALPLVGWLAEINTAMSLPSWMQGLEDWMRTSEDNATLLTEAFLKDTSIKGLIINIFMIGILAAVGEEMLFRGVVLRLFREWSGSKHFAVIFTAFLFSALHLQFYGFLPRFILGLVLGYMFVITGSLWMPILAHFVNNTFAVIAAWFYYRGNSSIDPESLGTSSNPYLIAFSILILFMLFYILIQKNRLQKAVEKNEYLQ